MDDHEPGPVAKSTSTNSDSRSYVWSYRSLQLLLRWYLFTSVNVETITKLLQDAKSELTPCSQTVRRKLRQFLGPDYTNYHTKDEVHLQIRRRFLKYSPRAFKEWLWKRQYRDFEKAVDSTISPDTSQVSTGQDSHVDSNCINPNILHCGQPSEQVPRNDCTLPRHLEKSADEHRKKRKRDDVKETDSQTERNIRLLHACHIPFQQITEELDVDLLTMEPLIPENEPWPKLVHDSTSIIHSLHSFISQYSELKRSKHPLSLTESLCEDINALILRDVNVCTTGSIISYSLGSSVEPMVTRSNKNKKSISKESNKERAFRMASMAYGPDGCTRDLIQVPTALEEDAWKVCIDESQLGDLIDDLNILRIDRRCCSEFWKRPNLGDVTNLDLHQMRTCQLCQHTESHSRAISVEHTSWSPSLDANCKDRFGNTPLHFATARRNSILNMVQSLLEHKAILKTTNTLGQTLLFSLEPEGLGQGVKDLNILLNVIRENDPKFNFLSVDCHGRTFFHYFIQRLKDRNPHYHPLEMTMTLEIIKFDELHDIVDNQGICLTAILRSVPQFFPGRDFNENWVPRVACWRSYLQEMITEGNPLPYPSLSSFNNQPSSYLSSSGDKFLLPWLSNPEIDNQMLASLSTIKADYSPPSYLSTSSSDNYTCINNCSESDGCSGCNSSLSRDPSVPHDDIKNILLGIGAQFDNKHPQNISSFNYLHTLSTQPIYDDQGETLLTAFLKLRRCSDLDRESYSTWIRKTLQEGSNINMKNRTGSTALMIATEYGTPYAIKTLLEEGASTDIQNYFSKNLFQMIRELLSPFKKRSHPEEEVDSLIQEEAGIFCSFLVILAHITGQPSLPKNHLFK